MHCLQLVLFVALSVASTTSAASCAVKTEYRCPSATAATGFELVTSCLSCPKNLFTDDEHNLCIHRTLFSNDEHYHFLGNDIGAALVWFMAAGIATACGVGGGGIYMPLGVLLAKFSAKSASGLSQASIFGASLGGLMLNMFNNHPNTKIRATRGCDRDFTRPLIDYNMVLFLAPMEMAGATLGVLIQKVLPNWLYLSLAILVLGFTTRSTYLNYAKRRAKEQDDHAADNADASASVTCATQEADDAAMNNSGDTDTSGAVASGMVATDEVKADAADAADTADAASRFSGTVELTIANIQSSDIEVDAESGDNSASLTDEQIKTQIAFLEMDARQFPAAKIVAALILWIVMIILTILKGGKGVKSLIGITCKDASYPLMIVVQFLWLFGFAVYYGLETVKEREQRQAVGYPFQPRDVMWSKDNLTFYAAASFVAGIVAGLIGIGGGMVLGPLMLVMGMDPRVSSSTTATMIVLTSSTVAVMYVITGYIPWEYFVFFFFTCFFGAYVGKRKIDAYVKETGMTSILIAILAIIIGLSTIGCIINLMLQLSDRDWCLDSFRPLCE